MSSTLLPRPPPTHAHRPRNSPRSVAAAKLTPSPTTTPPKKSLDFDEVEESSFLAGFASSLKFPDDDSWADPGNTNPFREAKVAAAAPTPAAAAPTTSSAAAAQTSTATTYQFDNYFESNNPFQDSAQSYESAQSYYQVSEATTAVGSNLLADKLLSNINASNNNDAVSPGQPVSPPKKVRSSDNHSSKKVGAPANSTFVTPESSPTKFTVNAPVRNWSRGKVKEELRRRSSSHVREDGSNSSEEDIRRDEVREDLELRSNPYGREKDGMRKEEDIRRGHSHRSRSYESEERSPVRERSVPFLFSNREDESTLHDENSYGTNDLTYRDNETAYTEDDSLTYRDNETLYTEDDSTTFLTPTPSSRRSRYSRRGHGGFLCGCEDTDTVANTMKGLNRVLKDVNRTMLQILSPLRNARRTQYEYDYDDVRPRRSRSQYDKRRSRSISVRRDRESSQSRIRRGKSCDPPRAMNRIDSY